jgi:hypothetical protein
MKNLGIFGVGTNRDRAGRTIRRHRAQFNLAGEEPAMRAGAKRRNHWLRRHAGAWLAGGLAVGLLSGCTVFAEEEPAPATIQAETDDDAFPALGSVPDAAPATTTAAEREVIIENLEADRTSATDPDGYAFTTIQTPPPAPTAMSTTTMPTTTTTTPGSGATTFPIAPATTLPAPQPMPGRKWRPAVR